jgi:hypothetical protein
VHAASTAAAAANIVRYTMVYGIKCPSRLELRSGDVRYF